jgi:NADPH:quinone reductase-like Zn-dependent oxidoreductase
MAKTPLTMGVDFAGEVEAVGPNVKHVKPGDAVYGLSPLGAGTFAEFTIAKEHEVTHKPKSLDYARAAALPLPTMAAWKSLFDLLQVQKGERLLIHGAAGNVGGLAVQLAKAEAYSSTERTFRRRPSMLENWESTGSSPAKNDSRMSS